MPVPFKKDPLKYNQMALFATNVFDLLSKDLIYNPGNFLFEYNHLKRHGGIDYQTPYEKLEKVAELLSYHRSSSGNNFSKRIWWRIKGDFTNGVKREK